MVEYAHAGSDAVFDLIVNQGIAIVHCGVAYFYATVNRTGVHDTEVEVIDEKEFMRLRKSGSLDNM